MSYVFLAAIAALLFGVSAAIQKYSLSAMKKFSMAMLLKSRIWLLSLAIGELGLLFYITALRIGSLAIVQSLLSLSIITPVLGGLALFKEKLKVYE